MVKIHAPQGANDDKERNTEKQQAEGKGCVGAFLFLFARRKKQQQ